MSMRLFVISKVNGQKFTEYNQQVKQVLVSAGYDVYLPAEHLPVGGPFDDQTIITTNEKAVDSAHGVVVLFEYLDIGGALELGRADALGKHSFGLRSLEHEKTVDLGKMIEGFWKRMPAWDKARSLEHLREIMERISYGPINYR